MTRLLALLIVVLVIAGIGLGVGLGPSGTNPRGARTHNSSPAANAAGTGAIQGTLDASCNVDARSVESAARAYQAQVGSFPSTLSALTATTVVSGQTLGPWLRELPTSTDYALTVDPTGDVTVHSRTGRGGGDYEATNHAACDL